MDANQAIYEGDHMKITMKTKKIFINLTPEIHAQFKALCALKKKTMQARIEKLITKDVETFTQSS